METKNTKEIYNMYKEKSPYYFVAMQRLYLDTAREFYGEKISEFYDKKNHLLEYKAINEMLYNAPVEDADYRSFKEMWQYANRVKHSDEEADFQENYARLCASAFNNIYSVLINTQEPLIDINKLTVASEPVFANEINRTINEYPDGKTAFEEITKKYQNETGIDKLENAELELDICPRCKRKLIRRTNHKTGEPFLGCSGWNPTDGCRFTMSIQEYNSKLKNIKLNKSPVDFIARPRTQESKVRFFQSLGVSSNHLAKITSNDEIKESILPYSHWRTDYIPSTYNISDQHKGVLSIAYKILTRGRITLVSPEMEKYIGEGADSFEDYSFYVKCYRDENSKSFWLDSNGTEQKFYFEYLKKIMGKAYYTYVIPQADLSALIKSENDLGNQRVDFALNDGDHKLVIEIDDGSHYAHKETDEVRDNYLEKCGFTVVRVKNREIYDGTGTNLFLLDRELSKYNNYSALGKDEINAIKIRLCHQLQVSIVDAMISGAIKSDSTISIDFNQDFKLEKEFSERIVSDLNDFVNRLSTLCGTDLECSLKVDNSNPEYVITYSQCCSPSVNQMIITDMVYGDDFVNNVPPFVVNFNYNLNKDNIEYFLRYIFRKENFRDGQYDVVRNSLMKIDSIVLLPTGAGKSIAFQMAAMLTPGITFVISPLISLMDDQIDNLCRNGLDRVTQISSTQTYLEKNQIQNILSKGDYHMVYIAPERLQMESFRSTLSATIADIPVPLFVIDEAHCLSEWGHDFRTAYLNLGRIIRDYCKYGGVSPTIVALTGTASESVLKDVQIQLDIQDEDNLVTPSSFDRAELHYAVIPCTSNNKGFVLEKLLENFIPQEFSEDKSTFYECKGTETKGGVVFCPHVNGEYGAWELYGRLKAEYNCDCYAGKRPRGYTGQLAWDEYKKQSAKAFKNNETALLVATNAFGMGIDKPNIRYTVHYNLPKSVEGYYQETGRAGRDRNMSWCFMLPYFKKVEESRFGADDSFKSEYMSNNAPLEDDLDRVAWFHENAFRGIATELEYVRMVLGSIDVNVEDKQSYNFSNRVMELPCNFGESLDESDYQQDIEKAVYRLLTIGVIEDYTKARNGEYLIANNKFSKEYIRDKYLLFVERYNKQRVEAERKQVEQFNSIDDPDEYILQYAESLLKFNYEVIEKGRMRQIKSMYDITMEAAALDDTNDQDKLIRQRILAILEFERIKSAKNITDYANCGFNEIIKILSKADTQEAIDRLYGKTARMLESTPDHPGLLMISALQTLSLAHSTQEDFNGIISEAINNAVNKYSVDEDVLLKFMAWYSNRIFGEYTQKYGDPAFSTYVSKVLEYINLDKILRYMINKSYKQDMLLYFLKKYMEKKTVSIKAAVEKIRGKRYE